VVKFIGYGGGRGLPTEHALLPALGYSVFVMDTRGQGGGLALATAALVPRVVAVCHADVPFLCDIQRAITLAPQPPYTEVPEFLAHSVDLIPAALDTLRYVDCALLARRITARCLLSVGLMDEICPPSTVFAAYNEITAGKDIAVHPFTGHAVPAAHVERQLRHFRDFLLGTEPVPQAAG
jgi:cephalosporin-C deacetylase